MKVTDITSTTTPYLKTAATQSASSQIKSASSTPVAKTGGVAETKASASTTPTSKTASTTIIANSPNKTASVKCASATIIATSSTTISYKGASTTVKAASAGTNASATVKAGASASSTIKATNASATPSASTTLYPYLGHMGGEAKQRVAKILKDIEMYNGTLKNNVVDEKELDLALQRFKNEFKVETSSLYSEKMVNAIKNVGLALKNISEVRQQLTDLDFYDVNGKEK